MEVKLGSPKSTVTIWTPTDVYELHSDMNDPNKESDVLSITTSNSLGSIIGNFTITFAPRPDANGKLWNEKLHVFDYVEIKMKGGGDLKERVVCRGLIDQVGISESFSGLPQRLIQVTGRDLGALLMDFSIMYLLGYDPWANVLKVFGWEDVPTEKIVNAQEAFDLIMNKWKELVKLTVGTIVMGKSEAGNIARPEVVPKSLNLSSKVQWKARAFFPDMKTYFDHLASYEGTIFNALEVYRDRPFHEIFLYEDDNQSVFVMRPSNLKDMKNNLPLEVETLKNSDRVLYPYGDADNKTDDLIVRPVEIIQQRYQHSNQQMFNYFLTVPKLSPYYGSDFQTVSIMLNADAPWNSINPFLSIKDESVKNPTEPLGWIGRYGIRQYPASSNFISMSDDSLGQLSMKNDKESGGDPNQSEASKSDSEYVKPSNVNSTANTKLDNNLTQWDDIVQDRASHYGLDPATIYGLMGAESSGNPKAKHANVDKYGRTTSTDWGLMQINDKYHSPVSKDPAGNVDQGASIFRDCYDDPAWINDAPDIRLHKAVNAYNAGAQNVKDSIDAGTWPNGMSDTTKTHWKNFKTIYDKAGGSLSTAQENVFQEASRFFQNAVKPVSASGKKPIRDAITDEGAWFGLRLNQVLVTWYLHNHLLRSGGLVIRGTNKAKLGTYVHVVEDINRGVIKKDYEYYIEGVTHTFNILQGFTTELKIERGQPINGGVFSDGFRGKFYFDTTRTVEEETREKYQKLSDEYKKSMESDTTKVPQTPEQAKEKIHPEA